MFKDIICSLTLISKIPLGFLSGNSADFRKAAQHFPAAGYASFAVWYVSFSLFSAIFTDSIVPVVLSLALVYYIFNLFHFDGFLDSIDGLLSQKPREEVLRIMKLGNIGPTALFFGSLYLFLKVYLASNTPVLYFLPVFVIARWGMSFSASISRPASQSGLGSMIAFGKKSCLVCSTFYVLPLFALGTPWLTAVLAVSVLAIDLILVKSVEARIGGLTGDVFGLINEINEIAILLILFGVKP